jgi:hypothetical protein
MRKLTVALIALVLLAALAVAGIATAAKPKPLGNYCSRYDCFQVDQTGKSISSFQGRCTAVKHPRFFFEVFAGIPINGRGKFTYDKKNAVNTPDGGTLSKEYRVTIDGKFVSKTEAKGTYQLHKAGCKKVSFDAKLSKN